MKNINKKKKLSETNEEWFNDRLAVFDLFWEDKIDFETFKEKFAEVDLKYKNPDEYNKREIAKTRAKIEELKEYKDHHRDIIDKYEQLKEDLKE